ncbi:hypothetical protein ACTXT7_009231 [Hymenolepis weldensis]
MSSNKIPLHPTKLSKPRIAEDQTYGFLTTHETLIYWIITYGAGQDVIGKEVEKHTHNTKFSSQMEAKDRGMETDMNKGHLMKACKCVRCPQKKFALSLSEAIQTRYK